MAAPKKAGRGQALPLLILEGAHLHALPGTHRQINVRDQEGIQALRAARAHGDRMVTLATEEHQLGGTAKGCLVRLIQDLDLGEDGHKVILTGLHRCLVFCGGDEDATGMAEFERVEDSGVPAETGSLAVRRSLARLVMDLEKVGYPHASTETLRNVRGSGDLSSYVDYLALTLSGSGDSEFCQQVVEETDVERRALMTISFLTRKIEEGHIERKIHRRVKKQMERSHHEFHLSEQAKAIQDELETDGKSEMDVLRKKVKDSGMSEAALKKCETELARLENIAPVSPEASVIKNYVETLAGLPWQSRSDANIRISKAKRILDGDHYGLAKVKDRILEYLAVQRRVGRSTGSVLCFVGPPGVGKTSLGRSIAHATGRKFVRVSLGGVHEESAIRGHRRTYVASMPGRILKAMAKAKVRDPVFMLDEFDKVASGFTFHGDPSAALLEVLDPEQNKTFTDQYVEVEFDLSEVLFITTANSVEHMPDALYDRLEVIDIPGYTAGEKIEVARRHLIPKQLAEHGLAAASVEFPVRALRKIVEDYTHEEGVRELERNIARVCRKVATQRVRDAKEGKAAYKVTNAKLDKLLEVPEHYLTFNPPARDKVGYVNGLVYGRGLCPMEAAVFEGEELTIDVTGAPSGSDEVGVLCEVALTLMNARRAELGLAGDFAKNAIVHVHLQSNAKSPYGALGLSMFALLASAFTKTPIRSGTALIGEVNLRGNVISSEYYSEYKSTVMNARRNKIKRIIMPHGDVRLLADLPRELTRDGDIEFVLVHDVMEALSHAFVRMPAPGHVAAGAKSGKDSISAH